MWATVQFLFEERSAVAAANLDYLSYDGFSIDFLGHWLNDGLHLWSRLTRFDNQCNSDTSGPPSLGSPCLSMRRERIRMMGEAVRLWNGFVRPDASTHDRIQCNIKRTVAAAAMRPTTA